MIFVLRSNLMFMSQTGVQEATMAVIGGTARNRSQFAGVLWLVIMILGAVVSVGID